MKSFKQSLKMIPIVFLASTGLACSTLTPMFGPSATPTPAPTPRPMRDGTMIYSQDFENPNVEFFSSYTDSMEAGPVDGGYRVFIREPNWASDLPLIYNETTVFSNNIIIEVDATKQGGPKDSSLMVVCREDGTSKIVFEIWEDGRAHIVIYKNFKIENSVFDYLTELGVPFHSGLATNRLHIECVGTDAALYVNGSLSLYMQTDVFAWGVVHLGAATYKEGGAEYIYDNLVVKKPAQ
jgi:hypothetical protein